MEPQTDAGQCTVTPTQSTAQAGRSAMTAIGFRNLTAIFVGLIYGVTAMADERDTGVALLEVSAPVGQNLEELVRARLPKSDTFVVVEAIPNTRLVQLTVFDPHQEQAARRATELAASVQLSVEKEGIARAKIRELPQATGDHARWTREKVIRIEVLKGRLESATKLGAERLDEVCRVLEIPERAATPFKKLNKVRSELKTHRVKDDPAQKEIIACLEAEESDHLMAVSERFVEVLSYGKELIAAEEAELATRLPR